MPRDIVCAPETIVGLCDRLDQLGAQTAMLICGPTILRHADVVQRVEQTLGERCVGRFAGVLPHAPVEMLDDAVSMTRALQPEVLVSLGGGSSLKWLRNRNGK